jgi:hypothetical protein
MAVNNLNSGVGIQPTIIDAKGDLLVGTGNDAINRLGVTGPTGSVLVTDAGETTGLKWVDPGTVGGLVHIETATFSAVSAVNVNDVFSSTYDDYRIIIRGVCASGAPSTNLRMRASGVDATGNNYNYQQLLAGSTTIAAAREIGISSTRIGFISSTGPGSIVLDIISPNLAEHTLITTLHNYANGTEVYSHAGAHTLTTAYTGFTFFPASSNITGRYSVYGYRK